MAVQKYIFTNQLITHQALSVRLAKQQLMETKPLKLEQGLSHWYIGFQLPLRGGSH
jgi:hypothetical protein